MIEGIKPTVSGLKLKALCEAQAAHHKRRIEVYSEQIANFNEAKVEAADFTGGDPIRALESKRSEHENQAKYLDFLAENLDVASTFLLDKADLQLVGVLPAGRYY